jgi:hypothetical protein
VVTLWPFSSGQARCDFVQTTADDIVVVSIFHCDQGRTEPLSVSRNEHKNILFFF